MKQSLQQPTGKDQVSARGFALGPVLYLLLTAVFFTLLFLLPPVTTALAFALLPLFVGLMILGQFL